MNSGDWPPLAAGKNKAQESWICLVSSATSMSSLHYPPPQCWLVLFGGVDQIFMRWQPTVTSNLRSSSVHPSKQARKSLARPPPHSAYGNWIRAWHPPLSLSSFSRQLNVRVSVISYFTYITAKMRATEFERMGVCGQSGGEELGLGRSEAMTGSDRWRCRSPPPSPPPTVQTDSQLRYIFLSVTFAPLSNCQKVAEFFFFFFFRVVVSAAKW